MNNNIIKNRNACCIDPCYLRGAFLAAEGLPAYGGLYSTISEPINIGVDVSKQVPFNNKMPSLNTKAEANTIKVYESGVYEINWKLSSTASVAIALDLAIRVNGTNIPSASTTRFLSIGLEQIFSGSVFVRLNAGDEIDMALAALLEVTVTLSSGTNATLSVKKISN